MFNRRQFDAAVAADRHVSADMLREGVTGSVSNKQQGTQPMNPGALPITRFKRNVNGVSRCGGKIAPNRLSTINELHGS
jgi:hypothetical protein